MNYSLCVHHCDVCGAGMMSPGTCSQCTAWAFDEEQRLIQTHERNHREDYWNKREDQVLRWRNMDLDFTRMAERFKVESAWHALTRLKIMYWETQNTSYQTAERQPDGSFKFASHELAPRYSPDDFDRIVESIREVLPKPE